jgi:hypothetical protein
VFEEWWFDHHANTFSEGELGCNVCDSIGNYQGPDGDNCGGDPFPGCPQSDELNSWFAATCTGVAGTYGEFRSAATNCVHAGTIEEWNYASAYAYLGESGYYWFYSAYTHGWDGPHSTGEINMEINETMV